jgi:hypothetical protein
VVETGRRKQLMKVTLSQQSCVDGLLLTVSLNAQQNEAVQINLITAIARPRQLFRF